MCRPRLVIALFWLVALTLGALDAWTSRHHMNSDGISYLDMGDAYLRGDWEMAINGYWSPLYSWLLGIAMLVLKPSPYWEFAVVHLVNFFIYVFALGCFHFYLRELICCHQGISASGGDEKAPLPEWAWLVAGYTLFIWSSLKLITIRLVSSDMCVAAFVYLACGILLRIRNRSARLSTFVLLGVVLGFAYLAKSYMFLMAFVILGVGLVSVGNLRRALPCAVIVLVLFLSVSGPFIVALSHAKGRLTFGDAGKLNYAWDVNGISKRHWQGEGPESGRALHPTRKIYDAPAAYEFAFPVGGTYPNWYDPSYWNEGVKIHFSLTEAAKRAFKNSYYYYELLFGLPGALIIGLFVLFYMSGQGMLVFGQNIAACWSLFVPALTALALFLALHLEGRFVAPWITIVLLTAFIGVRLADNKLVSAVTIIIFLTFILVMLPLAARDAILAVRGVFIEPSADGNGFLAIRSRAQRNVYWEVADGLRNMGLEPGDKVASTSYANRNNARWARLARVQIVAEVYDPKTTDEFWAIKHSAREKLLKAFYETGSKVVVADSVPYWATDTIGWQKVGETDYYAYFFQKDSRATSINYSVSSPISAAR
jgi:hypothetical protein